MTVTKEKIDTFHELCSDANSIVITAHKSPDGDSVGSSLGLYHYLKQLYTNISICHPDPAPEFLHWMEGYDQILNYESNPNDIKDKLANADVIFCLDYNAAARVGQMEAPLKASGAKKILIDHHRDPDLDFFDLAFSDIESCSTSQLVYEIIEESQHLSRINNAVGSSLYTGIVTDTGSFRFSSTTPKTHRIAADLLQRDIKHWEIHENIFDTNTLDRIQLVSNALLNKLEVLTKYQTAYISITADEQKKYNAKKGDTEGLVNQALGVVGVKLAAFFKESDGLIKISFRSKGAIPVNELAKQHFSGGGHLNAAGGKHLGKLEEAIEKFVTILPKFVDEHKDLFE